MEELGVAVHDKVSGAEVRLEAIRVVPKCSEEVACECLEEVVEDVDNGCTELLGLYATQKCINAADKKEATQYIDKVASKTLDARETKKGVAGSPAAGC